MERRSRWRSGGPGVGGEFSARGFPGSRRDLTGGKVNPGREE